MFDPALLPEEEGRRGCASWQSLPLASSLQEQKLPHARSKCPPAGAYRMSAKRREERGEKIKTARYLLSFDLRKQKWYRAARDQKTGPLPSSPRGKKVEGPIDLLWVYFFKKETHPAFSNSTSFSSRTGKERKELFPYHSFIGTREKGRKAIKRGMGAANEITPAS